MHPVKFVKSDAFRAISELPLNGAPAPEALVSSAITPAENFFLRNHGELSAVPPSWTFSIGGHVDPPSSGTVSSTEVPPSLQRFERHSVVASLQCAGNRRTAL